MGEKSTRKLLQGSQRQFKKLTPEQKDEIYDYYRERIEYFNEHSDQEASFSEHHGEFMQEQFIKIEDEIHMKFGVGFRQLRYIEMEKKEQQKKLATKDP